MQKPIIVALDHDRLDDALATCDLIDPTLCRVKVGKELFTSAGPAAVTALHQRGFEVFLDLKFHDIPNTVAKAVLAAADLGVWMVNVHASGGEAMMAHAASALAQRNMATKLIAVTVLTSMSEADLKQVGVDGGIDAQVLRLATLAQRAGLDGVVCSARESAALTKALGAEFLKVTPGIRPSFAAVDDQQRITTPAEALTNGSTHLVIGRPITRAKAPRDALQLIQREVEGVLSTR